MPGRDTKRLIGSRYTLESPLGSGGMGTVWRARDTLLQRSVAVKEVQLPPAVPEQEREVTRARVLREARAAARISHPGAVTVFDVVEEDGRPYIVMELVEAPTLEDVVRQDGPLDEGRAAAMGLELLGALEAAHAQGIVHRDVKPGNVMLPAAGPAKLADFGIASVKGDPRLTATGLVLGSPSYMAPEQAKEDVTGAASDLWSLGATLYFAVEGVPPFDKGQPIPTLTAVVGDAPRPVVRAGVMRPVLEALLEKDPERRPSPDRLRTLLEGAASGAPVLGTTPAPPSAEAGAGPLERRRKPRHRPGIAVIVAAGLLGFVALLLFVSMQRPEDPAPRPGGARPGAGERGPAAGVVPPEWEAYEDPVAGYRIAHPPGWSVEVVDDTRTDFVDPATGAYLRMDWTSSPGDDPVAAWEAQSDAFASRYADYREIRIEETTFQGRPAAEWEFTYRDGGAALHAIDLGLVTDSRGYALNLQTPADDWEESQDLWEAFKESFVPGGG